jgi:hypothetical protein
MRLKYGQKNGLYLPLATTAMDGGSAGYAGAITGRTPKSDRLLEEFSVPLKPVTKANLRWALSDANLRNYITRTPNQMERNQ